MSRLTIFILILIFFYNKNFSQSPPNKAAKIWVDSVFNALTPDERIGQLFMIRAHSDRDQKHVKEVERQIKQYNVGGICLFQGTLEKHAKFTNRFQEQAKVPLMVSIDGEWGLNMRLKEVMPFPRQLMLGAIQNNAWIYKMGEEVARQCNRIGIHVNFAPVADVNNNAENPVINTRSFGEDRYNVAFKSYMYAKGMQDNNIMACAKHFPGHGDTGVDSHYDLPVISHDRQHLDSIELYPFKVLAKYGVQSMMVAHLQVPALDTTANLPTTLSKKTITGLLRDDFNFNGLIFTDALEMKGITKHHRPGELEAKALQAGNDILLLPLQIDASIKKIKEYLKKGWLQQSEIDEKVKRILLAKYNLGLQQYKAADENNIQTDLNTSNAKILKRKLIENALTLVRNKKSRLPFRELNNFDAATLAINSTKLTAFQKSLSDYTSFQHLHLSNKQILKQEKDLLKVLKKKKTVIVSWHNMDRRSSKNFGINQEILLFLKKLNQETSVVLVVFGNPYSLKYFDDFEHILMAYNEEEMTQKISAQGLFGAFPFQGKLPVTASEKSRFNTGISTAPLMRLQYDLPESVGLNSAQLRKIDTLMQIVVDTAAAPACAVLVAKDGKVVYQKVHGFHTYDKKNPLSENDLFDLASITKVAAATLSVMKLYDEGKIDIEAPIGRYLPQLKGTNKADLIIKDIMAHLGDLKAWIPFYEQTVSKKKHPLPAFYNKEKKDTFNIQVCNDLYLVDGFDKKIMKQICESPLRNADDCDYKYSDLGFYLIAELVKTISGIPLDEYTQRTFYQPLGLSATFNPLKKVSPLSIVPSEKDDYWRHQEVRGFVHDMGAAMLGGVSGHAGLFATTNDIAVLMQMLLNGGTYGGIQFFKSETVELFTNRHDCSTRRGIGFDMKETDDKKTLNLSTLAPEETFGHLGFTGTCTWVDPINNIIYVFLSNRTYPSSSNSLLYKGDFRPRIQSLIYEALDTIDKKEIKTSTEDQQ